MKKISVIGAGAWGTALAQVCRQNDADTLVWALEPEVVQAINSAHENSVYLPGVPLDEGLRATGDLAEAGDADAVLLVAPAQHTRRITAQLAPDLKAGAPVVICSKGVEIGSFALMSEVCGETLPGHPVAILSGPTFAKEVAMGLPTAVTLACGDEAIGGELVEVLGIPTFRPYLWHDVIGAQIGGAIKNVIAIACGIVEGKKLGDNARAALMTRGLAELARYGQARGGAMETLMGLSGLGDLSLTCNSLQSRNMSLGAELGQGRTMAEVLAERNSVAEGVYTAAAVAGEAAARGIDMPICAAVDAICNGGARVDETVQALLSRPFTTEFR